MPRPAPRSTAPATLEPATPIAPRPTSRMSGFYRRSVDERRAVVGERISAEARAILSGGGLPIEIADRMSENVIGCHALPLSVALNFVVNGRDYLVPMAVEEPSVVAAASRAALLARAGGGFVGEADSPIMTAQIQLDEVRDPAAATAIVAAHRDEILAIGDRAIPTMVARGGGCRDLEVRIIDGDAGLVVVHAHVDVVDAMGANVVDTVAEATAERLAELLGGQVGLRILTNLPLRRLARARVAIPISSLSEPAAAEGVVRASRFAEADPMRAVTHNKGVMNGIDAAAVALGQDWRAIEAGAHAFASLSGIYRPLSTWRIHDGGAGPALCGRIELPLAVGTVGGATRVHPGVRTAFEIVCAPSSGELAVVLASAGLASNLAALHALAGEGIQRGHMRLHRRRCDAEPTSGGRE